MPTNFPTSLDSFSNPVGTDKVNNANAALVHSTQHSNANDAIEALEAKVGANGSAVNTSHDYKLSEVVSSDKAVGKSATQTLTNKTLTSPVINGTVTGDAIIPLANGGTGVALSDPNADRIMFWDDSEGKTAYLTVGSNLTITGTTLSATGVAGGVVTSVNPQPAFFCTAATSTNSNLATEVRLGKVIIPSQITASSITISITNYSSSGTLKLALFSEDGQTQYFSVTTSTITGNGPKKTTFSPVLIPAGTYYIGVLDPGGASGFSWRGFTYNSAFDDFNAVSSEPTVSGLLSGITSGVMPSTFNPTALTADPVTAAFRLDN